ncbi:MULTISPECIES: hypothetical protein [unclassified Kitasatospora]|uniref:WXG100-like domain-containing protein n=1 Tax=unclassified Kitasatospora TaxID=2633591 RepID=UPI00070AF8E5|nr:MULTISPECIES: hypothetical protein [unclassified Kitasatospora]KQV17528.1 hypothetical protein ASC99_25510 [Kitasatospora sp. Root107]KRB69224.1 hypothetical protein ASE03_27665 [Kitasatospora sp. Root187]
MIQLPPDLAEVLKVIQSNENGKSITFPDSNEDLLAELATAWERWNSVAEPRINAIVANARLAMENMEGDAADSFARYLEKFSGGDGSHAATTVSAAVAIAQALRGSIEAVTQTKTEMIRELQYTKEYIEDNPAGKNDDIAKSEGIKEAATTYTTYVGQVGSNVDTMLRQGAGHFRQMTAAAEVAALPGAQGGGSGSGGGPVTPPATTLDSVSGVTAPGPMTLQSYQGSPVGDTSGAVLPSGVPGGVSGGMPTGLAGGAFGGMPGGALGGAPGGALGGMPGGGTGGAAGGVAGGQASRPMAALQPFRMPTAAAPAAFGAPSMGAGGVPAFKPQGAVAPGLQLAGHQTTEETKLGLTRSGVMLRPFTPVGAESGGSLGGFSGGLGGLPGGAVGGRNTGGLAGRPGGLPGGTLTGRGAGAGGGLGGAAGRETGSAFAPGGRSAGGIGARSGGGGGSGLGGYSPGGGRSAGGVGGGVGGGAGSPVTAGGAGGGRGTGASGGAGAGGVAGRGATGGVPGMPGMGAAGGGGAGKSGGSRFVRPTRFGAEDDEEEETVRSDAGILGQAVNHQPQDQQWQRMRRRWVEESGMAPSGELPQTVVAGTEQASAPGAPAGTDLMSQLTVAMLGPETATTLNAPTDPASSTAAVAAPAAEDAFLERSRSVAERRGRPDAEPVAGAPAAQPGEPAPILEEEGFQVPSPFMRSALARLATTGAFPEGSSEPAAGQTGPATQGR